MYFIVLTNFDLTDLTEWCQTCQTRGGRCLGSSYFELTKYFYSVKYIKSPPRFSAQEMTPCSVLQQKEAWAPTVLHMSYHLLTPMETDSSSDNSSNLFSGSEEREESWDLSNSKRVWAEGTGTPLFRRYVCATFWQRVHPKPLCKSGRRTHRRWSEPTLRPFLQGAHSPPHRPQ